MEFTRNGRRYDTSELIHLRPCDGTCHGLYITPDGAYVFVVRCGRGQGIYVEQLDPSEIRDYFGKYPFPALAMALKRASVTPSAAQ